MLNINNNFSVKWYYNQLETTCVIYNNQQKISDSTIRRHFKDSPCRDKARRYSLAKALMNLPKEMRTEAWEAYRTMTKVPRWSPVIKKQRV